MFLEKSMSALASRCAADIWRGRFPAGAAGSGSPHPVQVGDRSRSQISRH
jgi:hypothetical protein